MNTRNGGILTGMAVYVCSLSASPNQVIQPQTWTTLKFPFEEDQLDTYAMHQPRQPDGVTVTSTDQRAGLIWPYMLGWGSVTSEFVWEAGGYTEIRDQYVRDPLGLTSDPNNATCLEHRALSPGAQYFSKAHEIQTVPGTPLAVQVWHNDTVARSVTYAQFKVAVHPYQ